MNIEGPFIIMLIKSQHEKLAVITLNQRIKK